MQSSADVTGLLKAWRAGDQTVHAGLAELERKQLVQRARTSSVQHQEE